MNKNVDGNSSPRELPSDDDDATQKFVVKEFTVDINWKCCIILYYV